MPRLTLALLAAAMLGLCASPAFAAPDEIAVYADDMDAPGEFGLEEHLNYVPQGQQQPAYPGQMPSDHVFQATSEFSYGLSKSLEAGLYVPLAITPGGYSYWNGLRVRLKYIAPRADDDPVFYGLNVEYGRDSMRTNDSITALELRPIIGYRDAHWLLSFNPILDTDTAGSADKRPYFQPAFKLTHSMGTGTQGGFEYYGDYGPLTQPFPSNQRAHSLFAVTDTQLGAYGIDFGIGRGFVNAQDTWVVKAIVDIPLY